MPQVYYSIEEVKRLLMNERMMLTAELMDLQKNSTGQVASGVYKAIVAIREMPPTRLDVRT
jgi:hypothetical protein